MATESNQTLRGLRILHLLATRRPLNKYKICQELEDKELGTEPTLLAAIDKLAKTRCILIVRTERNPRGPSPSNYYDLSILGLGELVRLLPQLKLDRAAVNGLFRDLAKKYHDYIPDVFEIWPAFGEAGIEDLAQRRLRVFSNQLYRDAWMSKRPRDVVHLSGFFFLEPSYLQLFQDDESQTRWMEGVCNNRTLATAFKRSFCKRLIDQLTDFTEQIDLFEKDSRNEALRKKAIDLKADLKSVEPELR